ncbi:MAG: glucose-1-phosphate cytidylyltransferase [Gemmatimonadales bacterium]|nr:glucose-1-phosphate cytidylyltransferase [Gemmatimonadales bacterium]
MQTVILAGGRGTRISEESATRPKPMVEIGGKPVLWHLMQIYGAHGFREFVVACGYKSEMIKSYFHNLLVLSSDFTIDLAHGKLEVAEGPRPDWRVSVVDTGLDTMTGGRIQRLAPWLGGTTFMATYGDGLADIDLRALTAYHRAHGKLATVTAVRPPARFGSLVLRDGRVEEFSEKSQAESGWINGGFFVFEPEVLQYLDGDGCILERGPLERLAEEGQLMAYQHEGFWQPMDTIREKEMLEAQWGSGRAPWRIWA